MGRPSLDSERPIMAPSLSSKRTSQRFSTYSTYSDRTLTTNDTAMTSELNRLNDGFEKLENKPLQQQRFVPSVEKSDNMSKLALGAKVERALGRRMTSQDAVMRVKPLSEKPVMERTASAAT